MNVKTLFIFLTVMTAMFLLSACQSPRAETATPPPPELYHWPAAVPEKGVVLALHSFGDQALAFDLLGPKLADHGYHVYAYDQAGFGARQLNGQWAGEVTLRNESIFFVQQLADQHSLPLFVLGESLGAAIAMLISTDVSEHIDGLILSAPAVREGIRLRYGWNGLIATGAAIRPGHEFVVDRQPDDPRLAPQAAQRLAKNDSVMRRVRMDTYWQLIRTADHASDMADQISHPTLLLYGGNDTSVPEIGIQRLRQHLADVGTYHYYPDGPHLLTQGHNWQQVADDIVSWLGQQVSQVAN